MSQISQHTNIKNVFDLSSIKPDPLCMFSVASNTVPLSPPKQLSHPVPSASDARPLLAPSLHSSLCSLERTSLTTWTKYYLIPTVNLGYPLPSSFAADQRKLLPRNNILRFLHTNHSPHHADQPNACPALPSPKPTAIQDPGDWVDTRA